MRFHWACCPCKKAGGFAFADIVKIGLAYHKDKVELSSGEWR